MAVQIPTIKRIDPPAPESVGRIRAEAPDAVPGMKVEAQAVEKIGAAAIDLATVQRKAEVDAIKEQVTSAQNEYTTWHRKQLDGDPDNRTAGLRHFQDDPTPAYNDFEKSASEMRKQLADPEQYSEEAREAVAAGLEDAHRRLLPGKLTAYGAQQYSYQEKLTNAAVENEKYVAGEAMQFVDGAPENFNALNDSLNRISSLKLDQAMKLGLAEPAEDGTVPYIADGQPVKLRVNPTILNETKKLRSGVIAEGVESLLREKKMLPAKLMLQNYELSILPDHRAKLNEAFKKLDVEQQAYEALSKAEGKPYSEQRKVIAAIKDLEVKEHALGLITTNENRTASLKQRDSDENFDRLAIALEKIQNSNDPITTAFGLDQTKIGGISFSKLVERVTDANQVKALYAMVEKKKAKSDPDVLSDMNRLYASGEMVGMPFPKFVQSAVGLNDHDYNDLYGDWKRLNDPTETEAQEAQRASRASDVAHSVYLASGLLRRVKGNETTESMERRNAFESYIRSKASLWPKGTPFEVISHWVNTEMAEEVKRQYHQDTGPLGQAVDKYFGNYLEKPKDIPITRKKTRNRGSSEGVPEYLKPSEVAPSATPAPTSGTKKTFKDLSDKEKNTLVDDYIKAHGKAPAKAKDLMDWYNSK